jgi:hypothetical protein
MTGRKETPETGCRRLIHAKRRMGGLNSPKSQVETFIELEMQEDRT